MLNSKIRMLFLVVALVYSGYLNAQNKTFPSFEVISLPAKLKYDKNKLTKELKDAKTIVDVKKIIESKRFPPAKILIKHYKENQHYVWITFNTESKAAIVDNHILLQSRNSYSTNIYKLSDFRNLFKDTVSFVDSLCLNLYLHDANYPDNSFEMKRGCTKNTLLNEKIPVIDSKLLIVPFTNSDCVDLPAYFILFNSKNPSRQISTCNLVFLSAETRQIIKDISENLKRSEPGIDLKEIASNIEAYIYNNGMGKIYFPQLMIMLNETHNN